MVDHNVGKLARWLRMMGYDSRFFGRGEDYELVRRALAEGRVLLTRDREIMRRRVVNSGRLKAVLLASEDPEQQMRQLLNNGDLLERMRPFTICLECNGSLEPRDKAALKDRLPPHVYRIQREFMECPACGRLYWRGTHWEAMLRRLEAFRNSAGD